MSEHAGGKADIGRLVTTIRIVHWVALLAVAVLAAASFVYVRAHFDALPQPLTSVDVDGILRLTGLFDVAMILLIAVVAGGVFFPLSRTLALRSVALADAHRSMEYLAAHDGLTGLHNRAFLVDHFETIIAGAERRGERVAVLQIDLDGFKQINDTLGHPAGDAVLVRTAQRMRDSSRSSDLNARLGGDEFVMVLVGAGTTEDIAHVASRVIGNLNSPIDYEGATVSVGASGGIAVYPTDGTRAQDLLIHADLALYDAKKTGGASFRFFSEELRQELDNRKKLEADLRAAIEARHFEVWFQPQVSLIDGSIAGVEALVRWPHAIRGMVAPGDFIPVAEKTGLMADIGRIVLDKAIAETAQWHADGLRFGRLSVNVSGSELREADFVDTLFATLARHGLPHELLSLEIVESVILDDVRTGVAAKLKVIRAAGIHLELDDFGTGYASLAHVNPNEIDRLKIDRRFVQDIDKHRDNGKIVRAITELARGLGIDIVAEGAETEAELDSLMAIGCSKVQGFSIAFPMPQGAAQEWLVARQPDRLRRPALSRAG
ncbi:MAG: EAL domain-containing protein [Rhizobiaceae bacterium]